IVLSIAIIFIVILSKRVDKSGENLEKQIASNHSEIKSLENTVRDINHRLYDAERDLRDTKRELSNIKNERFYYVEVDGESIVEFFNSNVTNPVTYPQNVEYEKHVGGVSYFKTYEP
ncbi:hypothetical protein CVR96_27995, partial [Salmonella enterica subsp. enterica serovar Typhimurium]|uniref:hypothetical protein n=1 Tax=Salmonella enterica TaxID=28901 RepID=UPI000CAB056C